MLQDFLGCFVSLRDMVLAQFRRLFATQVQAAVTVIETEQIVALRERAAELEQAGHEDLAKVLRQQAEALVKMLGENALPGATLLLPPSPTPARALANDPASQAVQKADVLHSTASSQRTPDTDSVVKRGRGRPPKHPRPGASSNHALDDDDEDAPEKT